MKNSLTIPTACSLLIAERSSASTGARVFSSAVSRRIIRTSRSPTSSRGPSSSTGMIC